MKKKKGFTLIELMIVVAIIGIISAIALPLYQNYTKRTYVSEGLALGTVVKTAWAECQLSSAGTEGGGHCSSQNLALGHPGLITGQAVIGIAANSSGFCREDWLQGFEEYREIKSKWLPANCRQQRDGNAM